MFGDIENNCKGYPIKQIDEFSDLFAGATPSTKVSAYWESGTIPWMSSGEVHMGRVTSTEKKITQLGYDKCSTKMVPLHTVVIALAGQGKTRGTVAITEIELCTNQSLCAMITDGTVLSEYLFHNLNNRYEEIRNMCAIAGGRGGLNLKIVGRIKVIVPSIEEQKRFVAFAEQSDKSKFYGKSQFIEMFGGYLESGNIVSLENVCNFIDYRGKTPPKVEKGIMLLTAKNVRDGYLSFEPREYMDADKFEKWMTRGIPQCGDILFTTEAPLGNVCRIPQINEPFAVGQRIITIQPNKEILNYDYVAYVLQSDYFKTEVDKQSTGSTAKGIKSRLLIKLGIPVPPLHDQEQFSEFAQQSDKSKLSSIG